MASIINATTTAGVSVAGDNSGSLQLATNNGTTAVTIDTSQNVGIGTSSPTSKLQVGTGAATNTVQAQFLGGVTVFENTGAPTSVPTITFNNDLDTGINNPGANLLALYTGGTERMRIDGSGNIGAPSGTNIYNASDARLKKNIQPLTKGLDAVNALKPVSFNWITDFCTVENDKIMYGFVAQDTREVDENLVEEFSNGSNVVVGDLTVEKAIRVNEKFIIPMLTKAIQELKAELDATKAEVQALKGTL